METPLVQSQHGVSLIGGGPVSRALVNTALAVAPHLVAADGGANRLLRLGHLPEAVIGDLDSINAAARERFADRIHHVPEQVTTDFDKALRHIQAPFVLALGVTGARLDHGLAVFNTLARHPALRCLVLGPQDLAFLSPPDLTLDLRRGSRLSLFPLGAVHGSSEGLRWPIDGLSFAPDARIGTSNEVVDGPVRLRFDTPRMLIILPRHALSVALDGLGLPRPPARGG